MSFLSKLKSPLMKRHFTLLHDSQFTIDVDQPTRSLVIYQIDASDNQGTLTLIVNVSDYLKERKK